MKRLIDVRHSCFKSSKIAEINVPAWPIPIHQTKLTIANPHITGWSIPQMPTPSIRRYVTATVRSMTSAKLIVKPVIQRQFRGRTRTSELILSVTEAKVCPGSITGATAPASTTEALRSGPSAGMARLRLDLRVSDFRKRRHVGRPRPRVQLVREHAVVPLVGFELRDPALGVVDVAEDLIA